jgi:hypothetical protein
MVQWLLDGIITYVIKAKKQYPLKYLFSHYMLQVLCIIIRDGLGLQQFLHMGWESCWAGLGWLDLV